MRGVKYPSSFADIVFTRLSAIGAGSRFFCAIDNKQKY